MEAERLWKEGRLREAVASAASALRDDPANTRVRTFYFELLCFRGEWSRARKQLEILASDPKQEQAALYYQRIVDAEVQRQELFQSPDLCRTWLQPAGMSGGRIDGIAYQEIRDGDYRLGPRLELLTSSGYLLMPFSEISEVVFEPARRLRDLLWRKARLKLSPARGSLDMGDALVPALAPLTFLHENESVQMGRMTVSDGDAPAGQKTLLAGEFEAPLLSIGSLRFGV